MSVTTDVTFSFDSISSSFSEETKVHQESFASSSSFAHDLPSLNILQQLSRTKTQHTPPTSPADHRPGSANSMDDIKVLMQSASTKGTSTPSCSSLQSNPFSTPPTSPVQPSDEFDELFNSLPDNSCSQFDMEMKAMSDFTSFDNPNYDFLDFSV
jgi:regulatory protein SWI5